MKWLTILALYGIFLYAHSQGKLYMNANVMYNDKGDELVAAIREVGDSYDRLALAANAYAKASNHARSVYDINGPDPSAVVPQLHDQLEKQAARFRQSVERLLDKAEEFEKVVDWIQKPDQLPDH